MTACITWHNPLKTILASGSCPGARANNYSSISLHECFCHIPSKHVMGMLTSVAAVLLLTESSEKTEICTATLSGLESCREADASKFEGFKHLFSPRVLLSTTDLHRWFSLCTWVICSQPSQGIGTVVAADTCLCLSLLSPSSFAAHSPTIKTGSWLRL